MSELDPVWSKMFTEQKERLMKRYDLTSEEYDNLIPFKYSELQNKEE